MKKIITWIIPLLANILLIIMIHWLNHYTIIFGFHINISGILVIFSSLYLKFYYQGLLVNLFTFGFYYAHYEMDALNLMILYATTQHTFLYYFRKKISDGNRTKLITLGITTTILITFLLGTIQIDLTNPRHYLMIVINLLINIAFVAGLIPWFFRIQKHTYEFFELPFLGTTLIEKDEST